MFNLGECVRATIYDLLIYPARGGARCFMSAILTSAEVLQGKIGPPENIAPAARTLLYNGHVRSKHRDTAADVCHEITIQSSLCMGREEAYWTSSHKLVGRR